MPVIAGSAPVRPAPPGGAPTGFATASYTAPDGTVWPLTDPRTGWFTVSEGVSGIDMTSYALTKDDYPRGGSRLRSYQAEERAVIWPLHVFGRDHMEFIGRWRALGEAFAASLHDGPGWLEIARPDGGRRRVRVVYQEGFEGQGKQGTGIISDTAILTLYAPDPYWVDPVPISERREHAGTGRDFFDPYPAVSSGQVLGTTTLTNPGSVEAWPTWTITGPASGATMTNLDTGESFSVDPTAVGHGLLLAGEQVTVTTDPPRVRYQDGSIWTGALNWPSAVLWSLRKGVNHVSFQVDGVGDGSAVEVSFNARYEMA
jgi:hypothetical protein